MRGRGDVYKHFADVKDAEKCFHGLATSLEVLSTSDDIARTWKHLSGSSTLVMWAWGSWEGGVIVIWQVGGVWAMLQL